MLHVPPGEQDVRLAEIANPAVVARLAPLIVTVPERDEPGPILLFGVLEGDA